MASSPNTLLCKFYGLYAVQIQEQSIIYFVIMENVFTPKFPVEEVYDLKGSTYGRAVSESEKLKENVILKDLDIKKGAIKLKLGEKEFLRNQLAHDCKVWLCKEFIYFLTI